jgi:putative redox protein
MVTITATYEGSLHCSAVHGPSGTNLVTDAPRDNEGSGESFSPTDLVATALATCTLTTMAIVARRENIAFAGATAVVEKVMVAQPRRRIGSLVTVITMPAGLSREHRTKLENAARHCPVHQSLHADVNAPLEFVYPPGS